MMAHRPAFVQAIDDFRATGIATSVVTFAEVVSGVSQSARQPAKSLRGYYGIATRTERPLLTLRVDRSCCAYNLMRNNIGCLRNPLRAQYLYIARRYGLIARR